MGKTKYIQIRYLLPAPLEREEVLATIKAEIYGPFAVHKSCRNLDKFTVTNVQYRLAQTDDDYNTIEEARRVAKRLEKVKTVDWNKLTKLSQSYNGNHEVGAYDSLYLHSIYKAATDEGFKSLDYHTLLKEAQEGKFDFWERNIPKKEKSHA